MNKSQVLEYLQRVDRKISRDFRPYASPESFVLKHGKAYTGFAVNQNAVKRGAPKQCFINAYRAVAQGANPKLRYVEGFALAHGLTFNHAWVVNEKNEILEPTWECTSGTPDYYGVTFDMETLNLFLVYLKSENFGGILDYTSVALEVEFGQLKSHLEKMTRKKSRRLKGESK